MANYRYPGSIWDKLPFIERYESFKQLGYPSDKSFELALKKWRYVPKHLQGKLRSLG